MFREYRIMDEPLKKSVETIVVGDPELDCMTLLNAVIIVHGGGLDAEGKERVTKWLTNRYKRPTPVAPGV